MRKALFTSGYCMMPTEPLSRMPSACILRRISNDVTKPGSFHFALPASALAQRPGSTLSTMECMVSTTKPALPAMPSRKQPSLFARNVLQTATHSS